MKQANTYSEIIGNRIHRKITAFFPEVKLRQSNENLTKINMISMIRRKVLYLQIVLIKQWDPIIAQQRVPFINICKAKKG